MTIQIPAHGEQGLIFYCPRRQKHIFRSCGKEYTVKLDGLEDQKIKLLDTGQEAFLWYELYYSNQIFLRICYKNGIKSRYKRYRIDKHGIWIRLDCDAFFYEDDENEDYSLVCSRFFS